MIAYNGKNYDKKGWILAEEKFDERYTAKFESIFTQGNGYLGLRNSLEEEYIKTMRGLFVAGTFNKAGEDEVTELPNLPDIINMEIHINGCRFQVNRDNVREYERSINLYTGETCRSMEWTSSAGDKIKIRFRRFVSYDNLHIIGSCMEIEALNNDITMSVISGIDAQVSNHGVQHFTEKAKRVHEGNILQISGKTSESDISISLATLHKVLRQGEEKEEKARIIDERRRVYCLYNLALEKGKSVCIEKISAVHTSRDLEYINEPVSFERVCLAALKNISCAAKDGYDRLLKESAKVWKKFWEEQDILIESSDAAGLMLRFALYHLQIMVRKGDNRIGIAAKGLSGEGYKGHSFWDTEIFIFPYFQFTQPDVARTLLEFRYKGLQGAKRKAAENAYEGAMYPWEAAWISDGEVTPYILGVDIHSGEDMLCLTGKLEQHITADIIFALWQYFLTTYDVDFMEKYGYEMILESGRFWNSRLEWIKENERYELRNVIGPDEYKENVDNNAYTNYMAYYNLQLTKNIISYLKQEKKEIYAYMDALYPERNLKVLEKEIEEKLKFIYLPKPDRESGIIPQFDGYFSLKEMDIKKYKDSLAVGSIFKDYSFADLQKYQVSKQADVVELLYQLEDIADENLKEKNYRYYEERTLHDSSLSKAIHSIMASDLDMRKKAYELFLGAALTDIGEEMNSCDMGIHSANMGGIWQAVVMGFGGTRIRGEKLHINPKLPECWKSLKYPLVWRGNNLVVDIKRDKIEIDNRGDEININICGKNICLKKGRNYFINENIKG